MFREFDNDSRNNQELQLHVDWFEAKTPVTVIAGEYIKLKDLFLEAYGVYVECKTDSHDTGNLCVELASNLYTLPEGCEGRIGYQSSPKAYEGLKSHLKSLPEAKRGVGLDAH